VSGRTLALVDAAAILIFVTIGLFSHHGGVSARGYARDAIPLLAGWFAAAWAFRAYTRPGLWRVVATWAVGVTLGVAVRALVLGRAWNGKEAAFLAVALVTVGLLVAALRGAVALLARSRYARGRGSPS
jgi:hypothetical protein